MIFISLCVSSQLFIHRDFAFVHTLCDTHTYPVFYTGYTNRVGTNAINIKEEDKKKIKNERKNNKKRKAIKMARKIAAMNILYRLNVSSYWYCSTTSNYLCSINVWTHTRTQTSSISFNAMFNLKLHINTLLHSSSIPSLVQFSSVAIAILCKYYY